MRSVDLAATPRDSRAVLVALYIEFVHRTEVDRDASHGTNDGSARAAVASRFGRAGCVILVRDGEGHAAVEHDLDGERLEVAAAMAIVRYSAAWDESEVIVVSDSRSRFDVSITLDNEGIWALAKTVAT